MYTPPDTLIPGDLDLVGLDGNALVIMGAVNKALRKAGNDAETIDSVMGEMTSGDYDHLLQVALAVTDGTL